MPNSAPFFLAPLLLSGALVLGQKLEPLKPKSMPGAPGGTRIEPPTNFLTPALFSIAALYNPAAISLSWLTNEILACA